MRALIQFALNQGVLLNVVFIGLVMFGAFLAVPNLPVEQFPNITFGEADITTSYPGALPDEVERLVTHEIEDSLRGMPNIEYVKSTSIAGQSTVHVKFVDDTDYDALFDELRFRVLSIQNRLPVQNGDPLTPQIAEQDVDEWLPVIQVNLVSADPDQVVPQRTLTLLGKELRMRLEQIDDVKKVLLSGDPPEQYVVALDAGKLEAQRLTASDVIRAMRDAGVAPPAGALTTSAGERLIRVDNRFRSRRDLLSVPVRKDGNGTIVTVADVADLSRTGIERVSGSIITTVNGQDTVSCKVLKISTGNALKIKRQVVAAVDDFLAARPEVAIDVVYTLDSTTKIKDGLGVLVNSLMFSVVLVVLLLFMFMANHGIKMTAVALTLSVIACLVVGFVDHTMWQALAIGSLTLFVMATCRAAVLTVSGIVFSFLGSLLVFYMTGQSINELTLLGFVLVTGIVVDDAVVVIENIQRHREAGCDTVTAVLNGTAEVFWPVVSATLTTMAAFLPLLMMTGSVGDFFSLVPIAVCVALAISLVECLLILPLHVVDLDRLFGAECGQHETDGEDVDAILTRPGIMGMTSRVYDRALNWTLNHPYLSISGSTALFVMAIAVLIAPFAGGPSILKLVFFPENTAVVQVFVRMPDGTPLAETDARVRQISEHIMARGVNNVASTTASAGMSVDLDYQMLRADQYAFIWAELPSRENRAFDDPKALIKALRADLEETFERDGVDIEVTAAKDGPPVGNPINIRVTGFENDAIMALVNDTLAFLNEQAKEGGELHGIIDLKHDRDRQAQILSFEPNRVALSTYDLREADVQQFVADALDGGYVGDYRRLDEDIPVRARLSRGSVGDPLDLLNVPIVNDADGRIVRFSDVGHVALSTTPATLIRRDFQRTVTITGNIREDAQVGAIDVVNRVSSWYRENAEQYPGVALAFGGESESTGKSYRSLVAAFGLAVMLIYAILSSQFRSYLQPFLIMSNIIFSFTGVILVMALFSLGANALPEGSVRPERSFFTVQSFMAIVGLTGLVINDAIVLINFINQRVADGLPLRLALRTAGHQRMRPILMTTATTIAGLLPMAIGVPEFSISWSPFATCFIAGLLVSTTMTLLVIPVLYQRLERIRYPGQWRIVSWARARRGRCEPTADEGLSEVTP